jgi:hypothetical protein
LHSSRENIFEEKKIINFQIFLCAKIKKNFFGENRSITNLTSAVSTTALLFAHVFVTGLSPPPHPQEISPLSKRGANTLGISLRL